MITINFKSIQIPVLASGKGWLAVDKPAGLTVHNETGKDLCTLARNYIQKKPNIFKHISLDTDFGIHPVHRLDKETSGVLLLAANREIFRFFSKQFESRSVKKRYIAIVHGPLATYKTDAQSETDNVWKTWQWPLAKDSGGRKNPVGSGKKQPCETRYRVMDQSAHYTMVEIELLTGRKHQIRRHAKLARHPVVGDSRYGSIRAVNFLKTNCNFNHLGLHARSLTFHLPEEQEPQMVETLELPVQMRKLFENDKNIYCPNEN
ncbi:MAG: RNA pseudouridine synthase [Desulfobacteraceae bacterium]|nr:RNA pseudouridine synthase [Desulfobacteraceae bacterium]MBC2755606.1 RNA pseudouridine synthase [Desulfobacteraceae bacterium]